MMSTADRQKMRIESVNLVEANYQVFTAGYLETPKKKINPGDDYGYLTALNERPEIIPCLARWVQQHTQGW